MAQPHFRLEAVPLTVSDNPVQVAYLRQVLGLLLLGLFTAFCGGWFGMSPTVLPLVAGHRIIGMLGIFGLIMWAQAASTGPNAKIAYYVFTFGMGMLVAPVVAITLMKVNGLQTLTLAATLTIVNTLALGAYAWLSKRDFSFMGGFLIVGLITMVVAMLLNAWLLHSPFMGLAIPVVLVLLFNGFILYDLSRLIHQPRLLPPTVAALSLFLDIFNLFMAYLRILDRR
jgi:FtsH-binding integral membrane protein